MNVSTIKFLCWLVSLGLTIGLSAFAYDFYQNADGLQNPYDPKRVENILRNVTEPEKQAAAGVDYKRDVSPRFIDMNWTGLEVRAPEPVEVEEGPKVATNDIDVTKLLSVQMIQFASWDRSVSKIYVAYGKDLAVGEYADRNTALLVEGDTLPSPYDKVAVSEIRGSSVLFSFTGSTQDAQEIGVDDQDESPIIVKLTESGMAVPVRGPSIIKKSDEKTLIVSAETTLYKKNHYMVGTEDQQSFEDNYPSILRDDMTYGTYYDPNTQRRSGIEIQSVRSGSIVERHGARKGDIILSINDHPVSSPQEAINFAKTNGNKYDSWNVEILRMGRRMTITFDNPQ